MHEGLGLSRRTHLATVREVRRLAVFRTSRSLCCLDRLRIILHGAFMTA